LRQKLAYQFLGAADISRSLQRRPEMNLSRLAFYGVLAMLTLPQLACVPSDPPLVKPEECTIDKRLVGVWKASRRDDILSEESETIFGSPGEATRGPAGLLVMRRNSQIVQDPEMDLFSVTAGNNTYLQIPVGRRIGLWDATNVKSYLLIRYEVTDTRLTMW